MDLCYCSHFLLLTPVLVSKSCHDNIPQIGCLIKFFSSISGSWKSKIKILTVLVSPRPVSLEDGHFLLCPDLCMYTFLMSFPLFYKNISPTG